MELPRGPWRAGEEVDVVDLRIAACETRVKATDFDAVHPLGGDDVTSAASASEPRTRPNRPSPRISTRSTAAVGNRVQTRRGACTRRRPLTEGACRASQHQACAGSPGRAAVTFVSTVSAGCSRWCSARLPDWGCCCRNSPMVETPLEGDLLAVITGQRGAGRVRVLAAQA